MGDFVFSMDAHVIEPKTLFAERLPAAMKDRGPKAERKDGYLNIICDNKIVHRMNMGDGYHGQERHGGVLPNLDPRLKDMAQDGIHAEVIYPTSGGVPYLVEDPELKLECSRIYNDWCMETFKPHPHRFVPTAVLPVAPGYIAQATAELERCIKLGYRSALVPCVLPEGLKFNSNDLDPLWAVAQEAGIPISWHVGTGSSPVYERGPGGAVINYVEVGNSAQRAVFQMVCGGVLERFPALQMVTVEAGASWLAFLCERMDEVYRAHQFYVKPKLSMMPSEFVKRQVSCTFQFDRACILSRSVTGVRPLLWAADYPHLEGTFPHSQKVIQGIFEGIDISAEDRAAILGGNAAKLFKIDIAKSLADAQATAARLSAGAETDAASLTAL
jgi:predicted TIM-barrel fold metal-dependent hydrolase